MSRYWHGTDRARCPLSSRYRGRFCCKTILGARAGNIDSRTAIKAQHRFNESFAPIRLLRVSRLLPSFALNFAQFPSRERMLLRAWTAPALSNFCRSKKILKPSRSSRMILL